MPEWVLRFGDTDLTKTVTLPEGQAPRGLALRGEWRVDRTPEQVEADTEAAASKAADKPAAPPLDAPTPAPPAVGPTPEQATDPLNLDKE